MLNLSGNKSCDWSFLAGVKKSSHVNLKDLWATDGLGFELFRCAMSLPRFEIVVDSYTF